MSKIYHSEDSKMSSIYVPQAGLLKSMDSHVNAPQQFDVRVIVVRNIIACSLKCHSTCGDKKVFGRFVFVEEIAKFLIFFNIHRQVLKESLVELDILFFIVAGTAACRSFVLIISQK